MEVLKRVGTLYKELEALRPLSPADEQRIMDKFRLDWNYHSNHLEGNQLTYGETKALILFGITAQGKPLKDHIEITGHNEAIQWILEIVKEKRPITENLIRELHELILKEPYEVDAITPDGKPTKKKIKIGEYKTIPNHVKTKTGEIFRFATPEETHAKMNDLVNWYRKEKEARENPVLLASLFHYKFIRIHPFDDGNGRTARILMNFILMNAGYPPVIIKTTDKENYFAALRQADAEIFEPFIEYIANNLHHSLEIMIQGAKGESIEEPDDIDKEIALLKAKLDKSDQIVETKSIEYLERFYAKSIISLQKYFQEKGSLFDEFYDSNIFCLSNLELDDLSTLNNHYYLNKLEDSELLKMLKAMKIVHINKTFRYKSNEEFDFSMAIKFVFEKTRIIITNETKEITFTLYYGEQLTEKQIKELVNAEIRRHKEFIEQKIADKEAW